MKFLIEQVVVVPLHFLMGRIFPPDPKWLSPVDPSSLHTTDRISAIPLVARPAGFIEAYRWVTNYQERPKVRGRLWEKERKLA